MINKKLPFVRELAHKYVGIDPVYEPIPVRPVVHYMMGGVSTDLNAKTLLDGFYAAGETACVSINGANRLGSNSLTELLVFGTRAGRSAAEYARSQPAPQSAPLSALANDEQRRLDGQFLRKEGVAVILGVDTLMDMARTSVNLLGNCLATAVVARWEGVELSAAERVSVGSLERTAVK